VKFGSRDAIVAAPEDPGPALPRELVRERAARAPRRLEAFCLMARERVGL